MTTITLSLAALRRIADNCTDPDTTDAIDELLGADIYGLQDMPADKLCNRLNAAADHLETKFGHVYPYPAALLRECARRFGLKS